MRTRKTRKFESLEERYLFAVMPIPTFGTDAGDSRDAQIIGHLESGDADDHYVLNLDAGDILDVDLTFIGQTPSSGLAGAAALKLVDGSGTMLMGPHTLGPGMLDIDAVAPASSPIREAVDSHSSLAVVIPATGTYQIDVARGTMNFGAYEIDMQVYRPVLESQPVGTVQKIWLDFDGTTFNPGATLGAGKNESITTSPLADFLDDWNLSQNHLQAVENAIEATVVENLKTDLENRFATTGVEVLTSDDGDLWGDPNVTRVIVSGSGAETGMGGAQFIGRAESVADIGNFDLEQTAIVQLDVLSGPDTPSNPDANASINHYDTGLNTAGKIALVGRTVGNIVSHEVGHLLGGNHTFGSPDLMGTGSVETMGGDIDYGVADFFLGFGPSTSVATGQQDSGAIFGLSMPRGMNKPEPFVHKVVVFDGTLGQDFLTVLPNGGVGSIRLSGASSRTFTNVVLFQFHGNNGDDYLNAQYSHVPIKAFGDDGNDTLKGGAFNDRLVGGAGIDTIFGYGGHDILEGGSGQDYLDGGSGNDDIFGNLASSPSDGVRDWLIGGSGYDEGWGDAADWAYVEAFWT